MGEDMGQNGKERCFLYREDNPGREDRRKSNWRSLRKSNRKLWQIQRAFCKGAKNGGGGIIIWYLGILQGLARGCRHFGESNTMCVPRENIEDDSPIKPIEEPRNDGSPHSEGVQNSRLTQIKPVVVHPEPSLTLQM